MRLHELKAQAAKIKSAANRARIMYMIELAETNASDTVRDEDSPERRALFEVETLEGYWLYMFRATLQSVMDCYSEYFGENPNHHIVKWVARRINQLEAEPTQEQKQPAPLEIDWSYYPYEEAENAWWAAHPDATQEQFEREFGPITHTQEIKTMKAELKKVKYNGQNLGNSKELVSAMSVVGLRKGELAELVTCRVYMGRARTASTVYASVWIKFPDDWASGSGTASGCGYHKESAAVGAAIRDSGIELYNDGKVVRIDGGGDYAIEEALIAVGKLAGGEGELLIVTH